MPPNLSGTTLGGDLWHSVGETKWWTSADGTISRFTPLEKGPLNPGADFEPPLRRSRGLTYIVRWNIE